MHIKCIQTDEEEITYGGFLCFQMIFLEQRKFRIPQKMKFPYQNNILSPVPSPKKKISRNNSEKVEQNSGQTAKKYYWN